MGRGGGEVTEGREAAPRQVMACVVCPAMLPRAVYWLRSAAITSLLQHDWRRRDARPRTARRLIPRPSSEPARPSCPRDVWCLVSAAVCLLSGPGSSLSTICCLVPAAVCLLSGLSSSLSTVCCLVPVAACLLSVVWFGQQPVYCLLSGPSSCLSTVCVVWSGQQPLSGMLSGPSSRLFTVRCLVPAAV